jgi:hypothetical protein
MSSPAHRIYFVITPEYEDKILKFKPFLLFSYLGEHKMPNYICRERPTHPINRVQFDFLLEHACNVCFYPLNAGDLCPDCQKLVAEEEKRQAEIAGRWLNNVLSGDSCRYVHVFGVGYVDSWSRAGKRYLDD